jgi:hypothetical protein
MRIELSDAAWTALGAGAVYLLAWVAGVLVPAGAARLLARRNAPASRRVLAWPGWGSVARILGLAFSLGYLYLVLIESNLDAYTVGLWPPDWSEYASWLPAVAGLTSAWCGLLWGVYWARTADLDDHSPWRTYGTPLGTPAHVMNMEVQASILRGALVPALGSYWGPWAALAVRALISLANPSLCVRLRNSQARAFLYLDLAADATAAACFVVSGNLWVSLVARAALHLAAGLIHRILFWRGRRSRHFSAASGEQSPGIAG